MTTTKSPRKASSRSRRGKSLTRSRIVAAGLGLMNRLGPDAMTMRGLAAHLGVTPMALYNHVGDKSDLLRDIASKVVDGIEFDRPNLCWQDRVEHCFGELRSVCRRHPGLMRVVETSDVTPTSMFAPMNVTMNALREAGLTDLDALRTYFMLVHYTLGQAAYEAHGPFVDLDPTTKNWSERIAGRGYAALESLEIPDVWDFDAAFKFGLRLILEGVERRTESSAKAGSPRNA